MDLSNITNSQLWTTIVSFLTLNFGTILAVSIALVKNRVKSINLAEQLEKLEKKADIKLGEKYEAKAEEVQDRLEAKFDEFFDKICERLKLDAEEKKNIVEENAAAINQLILETQNQLLQEGTEEAKEGE